MTGREGGRRFGALNRWRDGRCHLALAGVLVNGYAVFAFLFEILGGSLTRAGFKCGFHHRAKAKDEQQDDLGMIENPVHEEVLG